MYCYPCRQISKCTIASNAAALRCSRLQIQIFEATLKGVGKCSRYKHDEVATRYPKACGLCRTPTPNISMRNDCCIPTQNRPCRGECTLLSSTGTLYTSSWVVTTPSSSISTLYCSPIVVTNSRAEAGACAAKPLMISMPYVSIPFLHLRTSTLTVLVCDDALGFADSLLGFLYDVVWSVVGKADNNGSLGSDSHGGSGE